MMHPVLRSRLGPLARRLAWQQLGWRLALGWTLAALLGALVLGLQKAGGWGSSLTWLGVAVGGGALALGVAFRSGRREPDWRGLARRVEAAHPDLDGRLTTAIQQNATTFQGLGYLQERVVLEALDHSHRHRWSRVVPLPRVLLAHAAQFLPLAAFAALIWMLRAHAPTGLLVVAPRMAAITVTPGDTALERGESLVVLVHFGGTVPARADLVVTEPGRPERRVPLTRSLNDPMFGGSLAEVTNRLAYRVEHGGEATRDFTVTVYEHPRLERSDADLTFPAYTGLAPKRVEDTRRVSAAEGTRVRLALQLNHPVVSARLVPKAPDVAPVELTVLTNQPAVVLPDFLLAASGAYDLRLVDADGRTNKLPAVFTFTALPNRAPELKLVSPRGDVRPSPIEEIGFDGTVWDDYGVRAYGLAYLRPGEEPVYLEFGQTVPAKEKRAFAHRLRLEDLGVGPDDLLSWFVWADDVGADGQVRRTQGDLFFAEIRPFDEVFREGEGQAGGDQQPSPAGGEPGGESGSPSAKLAELQKQIINATWKLLRDEASGRTRKPGSPMTNAPTAGPATTGALGTPPFPAARLPATAVDLRGRPPSRLGPDFPRTASPVARVFGQRAPDRPLPDRPAPGRDRPVPPRADTKPAGAPTDDAGVVRDSQAQALEQAESAKTETEDPRLAALWDAATRAMEQAVTKLKLAGESPAALREAFAAEQTAYQALLKLQEHEYAVARNRNNRAQRGNAGGRQQQMQRQLDQLELTQSENRYQTESQAQAPASPGQREQLQVMNRLQELARRQQDLNERLQEMQTALQEARTEPEREALRRELKRLQEEERQMLADMDELQQRMDRSENPSRLAESRQQLEQTRQDVQRAAEALNEGTVSQALAAGTRAQRQLQEMREELRRRSAGEFGEDLREMRNRARELDREQAAIQQQLDALGDQRNRALSDADTRKEVLDRLARQRQRLTNLVAQATDLSQQTEEAEPLVSRELYDTLRRFSQDDGGQMKRMRQELLEAGQLTYSLDDRLQAGAGEEAQGLELTAEMLRQGYLPRATEAEARARAGIGDLRRGVERATEKVLGDEAEALRLAQRELDELADQLEQEMAAAGGPRSGESPGGREPARAGGQDAAGEAGSPGTQTPRGPADPAGQPTAGAGETGEEGDPPGQEGPPTGTAETAGTRPGAGNRARPGAGEQSGQPRAPGESAEPGEPNSQNQAGQAGQPGQPGQPAGEAQSGRPGSPGTGEQPGQRDQAGRTPRDGSPRQGGQRAGGATAGPGGRGGLMPFNLDDLLEPGPREFTGPITGEDFANWSDRLREVEELVDFPELRTEIANARERARQLRQDFRRERQKPDWAVVRLQILKPLVDVRTRIGEELARRDPREALVPVDRDPVPGRYAESVRRYYEELGKGSRP